MPSSGSAHAFTSGILCANPGACLQGSPRPEGPESLTPTQEQPGKELRGPPRTLEPGLALQLVWGAGLFTGGGVPCRLQNTEHIQEKLSSCGTTRGSLARARGSSVPRARGSSAPRARGSSAPRAPLRRPLFTAAEKEPASILEVGEPHCCGCCHCPCRGCAQDIRVRLTRSSRLRVGVHRELRHHFLPPLFPPTGLPPGADGLPLLSLAIRRKGCGTRSPERN